MLAPRHSPLTDHYQISKMKFDINHLMFVGVALVTLGVGAASETKVRLHRRDITALAFRLWRHHAGNAWREEVPPRSLKGL
jgi:hypothetical protein